MNNYKLLINGELVEGDQTMSVINPATEEVLAISPRASEAQLNVAVAAAKSALPDWRATPMSERKALMTKVADTVEAHADEIAGILVQEQGKPLVQAVEEVHGFVYFCRYFCTLDLPVEIIEDNDAIRIEAHRKPLGVVAAIVPWNFPLALLAFKLPPALLSGNTLVLKPASTTPLSTLKIAELVKDILPAGTLNVITDDNDLGAILTAHPDVRKVSFTGSTATGAKVMAGAAASIKRVTLELGGNDAAIIMADADPKQVAAKLFSGAFTNSGQICIAIKRLYIHDSIYDELCDELTAIAEKAIMGNGLDAETTIGPLQNAAQYQRVIQVIEEAKQQGTLIAGGEYDSKPGYFISPTLFRDIEDGTRLVDEEQFGPVLPLIKYSDDDTVIEKVNASEMGLGGSVWGTDLDKAYAIAARLDSGTIWINKHGELNPMAPFGGAKQSGLGAELGKEGLLEFTQLKVINMAK